MAQWKRYMQAGVKIEMVRHDWFPVLSDKVSGIREVAKIQSNAIVFRNNDGRNSWLSFPSASMMRFSSEGFSVQLDPENTNEFMHYEYR